MTAGSMNQFSTLQFQDFLDREFGETEIFGDEDENPGKKKEKDIKNFFMIDEAHNAFLKEDKDSGGLLQFMDMTYAQRYNLAFVNVYNTDKSNMMPDLFRPGRNPFQIFLNPLAPDEGKDLLLFVESEINLDEEYVDGDQFNRWLREETKEQDLLLSPKDSITAGEVFTCQKSIGISSAFEKELNTMEKNYGKSKVTFPKI